MRWNICSRRRIFEAHAKKENTSPHLLFHDIYGQQSQISGITFNLLMTQTHSSINQ